jgi:hypothetical protein
MVAILDVPLPRPTREQGLLGAALFYAAIGWDVVQLRFGAKALHPRLGSGHALAEHATRDPEVIRSRWSGADRFCGIGIVQGGQTVVLDYDRKAGAHPRTEIEARCAALGVTLPATGPIVRTPTGEHEHYRTPPGAPLARCAGYLPGIDVQAAGSYTVVPPTHLHPAVYGPPDAGHHQAWEDPRPWPGYWWVRPELPRWSDDAPVGSFAALAGTAAPELTADQVWWPTGAELLAALSGAVLPPELVADVRAAPSRSGRSGGGSGGGGVPVEEWRRTGLPHTGETQRHRLFLVAASGAGRGVHPEETFRVLREIADRTELTRPNEPWTDAHLRFMAHNAVTNKPNRDQRDRARVQELSNVIDFRIPS